jgi:chromosome segregation ATPase
MDNEKFQDLMLEHFGKVLNKLDGLESRLGNVESRLGNVESRLGNVESRLGNVESRLGNVESRLDNVDSRLDNVDSRMGNLESELSGVKQSQAHMENDFGKKLDILYYDWREAQKRFNEEIKIEVKNLSTKVEALQMESTKHDQEIKDLTESKFYLVKAPKE